MGNLPVRPGYQPGGMGTSLVANPVARKSAEHPPVPRGRLPHGTGRLPVLSRPDPCSVLEFGLNEHRALCSELLSTIPVIVFAIRRSWNPATSRSSQQIPMRKTGIIIFFLLTAVALAIDDYWELGAARQIPLALRVLAFGLLFVLFSAEGAFGSRETLAQNAESIGTRNPRLARIACVIGLPVGLLLIVVSILIPFLKF